MVASTTLRLSAARLPEVQPLDRSQVAPLHFRLVNQTEAVPLSRSWQETALSLPEGGKLEPTRLALGFENPRPCRPPFRSKRERMRHPVDKLDMAG